MSQRRRITAKDILSGRAGSFLVMENLPFVFFLAFLATVYIANSRYAEHNLRDIQGLQREVRELNYEYMSLKSALMQSSMQSEVAKKVDKVGLRELTDKPFKIVVKEGEY
ncbi:MAG: FtsL-like putative cell division protein [Saprospiraceae bacterium]